MNRRRFVFLGALAMACRPDKVLQTICASPMAAYQIANTPSSTLKDVFVVNDFTGTQLGTQANPFSVNSAAEFDGLMQTISVDNYIRLHLSGAFLTRGAYEFGPFADLGWRMGRYWQIEGNGSTMTLDSSAIPDSQIDSSPMHIIRTSEQTTFPETNAVTPQQVWDNIPRGQAVRQLIFNASHTVLADRWKAADCILQTRGIILQGHNAAIEGCGFKNFGALKNSGGGPAEAFPASISGAIGTPDRDKIAQLDPATHIYDQDGEPSHITDCIFDDYSPADSNDQVTVFMIVATIGEPGGWNTGNFVQTYRARCYQSGNKIIASGKNLVQGHTIYQSLDGLVYNNQTIGASKGYYGDFYSTRGVKIFNNSFMTCDNGVHLLISLTGPGAEQFSHEGYRIGPNTVDSSDVNVYFDTHGPTTPTRFIRDMEVDSGLSFRNANNGATDVRRTTIC